MSLPAIPQEPVPLQGRDIRDYMRSYLGILQRRWLVFVSVAVAVLALGLAIIATSKPVYETSATVLVPTGPDTDGGGDSTNPFQPILAAARPNGFDAQLQMLRSASLLEDAKQQAGVRGLQGFGAPSVTVEPQPEAHVITVRVEGGEPKTIAKLANTVVALHLKRMGQTTTGGYRDALEFAKTEQQKAAQSLARAEGNLLRFQKAHPGVDIPSEHEARAGEYAALLARVNEAESNLSVVKAERDQLQARLSRQPSTLSEVSTRDNPLVEKLQSRLDDLNLQRTEMLAQFRPTSRQVQDLDREIRTLRRQLNAAPKEVSVRTHVPNQARVFLQSQVDALEASIRGHQQNYITSLAQLKVKEASLKDLGPWNTELGRLNRERDAAQAGYNLISERVRDLEIRSRAWARAPGNTDVIASAAVPTTPSRSRRTKYLALFLLVALVMACGSALIADFLDDRVIPQRPNQFQLPVLGYIPELPGGADPLLTAVPADDRLGESYRILRANIQFAAMETPLRTFVVTSAQSGDGKSTVALNLAVTMAMAGRTVVLVDADLRRSSLHRLLKLSLQGGLADVLERDLPLDQAIHPTQVHGVSVLPGGVSTADPADLLSSERMTRLIGELQSRADVVIFDTPPGLSLTDARILAAQVDGVLLIARALETRKAEITRMLDLLDQAYARTIGLVINKAGQTERPLGPAPRRRELGIMRTGDRKELPAAPSQMREVWGLKPGHALTYLGLFLFTAVLYFRPYEYIPALATFPMALTMAIVTLLAYVPTQLRLEQTLTARLPEVRLVLCLCLLALLSIPFAASPSAAWSSFNDPFVKAVLIFVVIVNAVRNERRLQGLLLLGLAVSCVLSIAAINDYRLGHFQVEGYRTAGVIGGMFLNPNDMALHLVTMTPIAVAMMLGTRKTAARLLYGLCTLIIVAGNVVTYSRGGFLGLLAVALVLGWRLGRRHPGAVTAVAAISVLLFVMLAPHDYGLRAASIVDFQLDPNGSAESRRDLLIRSIQVALHNPVLGVGIGNFAIVGIGEHVSHNAYTQVAAEMGLPALIVYVSFLIWPLKQLRRIEREAFARPGTTHLRFLAIGLQASLIGYMVSSFFASVAYQWYPYYLVGYATCLRRLYLGRQVLVTHPITGSSKRPTWSRAGCQNPAGRSVIRRTMEAAK